jgi:hypothetical protein
VSLQQPVRLEALLHRELQDAGIVSRSDPAELDVVPVDDRGVADAAGTSPMPPHPSSDTTV